MSETTIRHPFPCSRCGYDLEGLAARTACPECGLPIVESLAQQLDVESSSLRPTPAIRRTSTAILLVSLGALGGTMPFVAYLAAWATDAFSIGAKLAETARHSAEIVSVAGACAGAAGVLVVLPWTRARSAEAKSDDAHGAPAVTPTGGRLGRLVGRPIDRTLLLPRAAGGFGFLMSGALSLYPLDLLALVLSSLPLIVVLFALSPVLALLGPRCRAYRNAQATAQRIDGLVISTAIAGAAGLAALRLRRDIDGGWLAEDAPLVLGMVAGAAGALTVIGLGYLVLNAVWILASSGHPLKTVEEAFGARSGPGLSR